jgi:hypothetical protein
MAGEHARHGTTQGTRFKEGVAFLTLLQTSGRAFRRWRGDEEGDRGDGGEMSRRWLGLATRKGALE